MHVQSHLVESSGMSIPSEKLLEMHAVIKRAKSSHFGSCCTLVHIDHCVCNGHVVQYGAKDGSNANGIIPLACMYALMWTFLLMGMQTHTV